MFGSILTLIMALGFPDAPLQISVFFGTVLGIFGVAFVGALVLAHAKGASL